MTARVARSFHKPKSHIRRRLTCELKSIDIYKSAAQFRNKQTSSIAHDRTASALLTPSEGFGKIFVRAEELSKVSLLGVSTLFRWLPKKNPAFVRC